MPSARLKRLFAQLLPAPTGANDVVYDDAWEAYKQAGLKALDEAGTEYRGPAKFDANGKLVPEIMDAYSRNGFYLFTGVVSKEEMKGIETEFDQLLDQGAPCEAGSTVNKHGTPLRNPSGAPSHPGYFTMGKRPGDRNGKQTEIGLINHPLHMMDSCLRVYGHPNILGIIASINGPDFIPMNEGIFHKGAGYGGPTAWHQDGRTHWDLDKNGTAMEYSFGPSGHKEGNRGFERTHGVNFSLSFGTARPENCLWIIPGSHKQWLLVDGQSFPNITNRLEGAVPAILEPGDCCMVSRSSLHGSYANRSDSRRVTMVMSFHNRASALDTETTNVHAFRQGGSEKRVKYTEDHILRRARMIPIAIDARSKRYTDETPFNYKGAYYGDGKWKDDETRKEILEEGREYWQYNITL